MSFHLVVMILLPIFVIAKQRKEVYNEMSYKNGLINQIFNLLLLIETQKNQSIIRKIEGLLNALRDED